MPTPNLPSTNLPSLTLKRRFPAPIHLVYRAWTEPALMMNWFAPAGARVLRAKAQPQVGGRFCVLMLTPDNIEHEVRGLYREVVPNEKLVFSWSWVSEPGTESLVTVELHSVDGATELTLRHEQLPSESSRDGHRIGWEGALDTLYMWIEALALAV